MAHSHKHQVGFTIVELLIVIVVIGILAAITIVAYNGITARAQTAVLQSDLEQNYQSLLAYKTLNDSFPASQTLAGLKSSNGSTLTYNVSADGQSFCLQAAGTLYYYFVIQSGSLPTQGYCSGVTGIASTNGPPSGNGGVVTTLAGNGTAGYVNGACASAEFNGGQGMAVDSSGNIYVADTANNAIRKITVSPTCSVSTFAGSTSGTSGSTNGTGTAARFNSPSAVAIDSSGNLYVADNGNNKIRKITSGGVVSPYAGTGTAGFADGAATSTAKFSNVYGIAVGPTGIVYVSERAGPGNDDIRAVDSTGTTVSSLAGDRTQGYNDGPGATAEFMDPQFLSTDNSGNLLLGNWSNSGWNASYVRKITPSGVVSTLAGAGTDGFLNGSLSTAQFNEPIGAVSDGSGNIFINDAGNNCIRKIASGATVVSNFVGTCTTSPGHVDGTGTAAVLNIPWSIAVGPTGTLYSYQYYGDYIVMIQ